MEPAPVDYPRARTQLCLSVLVEVMTVLGAYRDRLVLIGGWVPYLLLPEGVPEHVGSIDVDLAVDFLHVTDNEYATIRDLLEAAGYRQAADQPFRFFRQLADAAGTEIEIDLLAGEYGGTGRGHRTQPVQDLRARKARGCDLAFEDVVTIPVRGRLPDGGDTEVRVRVAGVVAFLVMKANALSERNKRKDAYDIAYVVEHYPGGTEALAAAFVPLMANGLVAEALGKLRAEFRSVGWRGPVAVAAFNETADQEEKDRIARDAFERVSALLDLLGVPRAS